MTSLKTLPQFLSILIATLAAAVIFSGYQGSLLIELILPGGGARVHLEHLDSTSKFHDDGETPASNTGLYSQALSRSGPGGSPSLEL